MTDSLAGYAHICDYPYTDPFGAVLFVKQRFELLDPIRNKRTKTFRYFDSATGQSRKPPGADRLLYRLHEVAPAIAAAQTIHWAEGEKDSDALARAGLVSTSHHQGAGRVTEDQAAWLVGARRIVLWVDVDRGHYEIGAYDAALRYNLLLDAGMEASTIQFVRARRGKDAFDHLAAGYSPLQAIRVDPDKLAAVARDFKPAQARRLGYRHV